MPAPRCRSLVAMVLLTTLGRLAGAAAPGPAGGEHVGRAVCAGCHPDEAAAHAGSHHDLAMAEATAESVRGDFDGTTFTYAGVTSRFFRRGEALWVRTDGPDGRLVDYEVTHTFGIEPLQQYLIAMPGGRLQALSIAWDTRPREAGGQRWFHLYPGESVGHDDVLHWTKPGQNWNDRCARCHSTGLRKGYDAARDAYATTWVEIDVSCEACHGPGRKHVLWARREPRRASISKGLRVRLGERTPARWTYGGDDPIARREPARTTDAEIRVCAPCHSRRTDLGDDGVVGAPLLDAYRPALIEDGLYFADGQIRDEVYVWGSFLQSRMHAAGVTCSDCHEPHSLRLRAEGNAVCATCHVPTVFDDSSHTGHPAGGPGSRCVDCHMPSRTYMVVDDRRDHGFRVPQPAMSARLGAPDPCTGCHTDRDAAWAAAVLAERGRARRVRSPAFGDALAAAWRGAADAVPRLVELANDPAEPVIARATAITALGGRAGPDALEALLRAAGSAEPLLRLAAASALESADPRVVGEVGARLLADPLRAVRLEAVPALAGVVARLGSPQVAARWAAAESEFRAVHLAASDRPESAMALALVAERRGRLDDAERHLQRAMRLAPYYVPAHLNLADLRRAQGREGDAEVLLRGIVERVPDSADAHHGFGLLLVRTGRTPAAVEHFERAVEIAPDVARHAYVLGLALRSTGETARALDVLRAPHARRPGEAEILLALATITRDEGDVVEAGRWARLLRDVVPWDPAASRLVAELDRGGTAR